MISRQVVVMKWDWPMRPIKSGPLTNWEIEELDVFLLADEAECHHALRVDAVGLG